MKKDMRLQFFTEEEKAVLHRSSHFPVFRYGKREKNRVSQKVLSSRSEFLTFVGVLGVMVLVVLTGCSRERYRTNADKEVYGLLNTVNQQDPLWKMENFNIEQNKDSRYSQFYDPDNQPMPQDDATAQRLMRSVDGMKGYRKWWDNGCVDTVENEAWRDTLPMNEKGEVVLDPDTVFDLALLHSPEYRTAMENIYLAALNVTAERYAFDVKFYGGDSLLFNNRGGFKDGTSTLENRLGGGDYGVGTPLASKHFATGADVVVGIANSMVWTFSPGDQSFNPTTELSYNITQPLLRGAGRAIALESLTLSERQLLANVRQLAFYQQGFYVGVLTGSNPIAAPSENGYANSFTGKASLNNASYYGLLQSQVEIRNQQSQVASLKDNLNQYEEYYKAGRMDDRTQVEQVRNKLLSGQSTLVSLKDQYQNNIDTYLIALGLPPDLDHVAIEDSFVAQFTLMSPAMTELDTQIYDKLAILRNDKEPMPEDIKETIQDYRIRTEAGIQDVLEDLENLKRVVPNRKTALENLSERLAAEHSELDHSFCDLDVFENKIAQIYKDFEDAQTSLNDILRLMDLTIMSHSSEELSQMIEATRENPSRSPFGRDVIALIRKLKLQKEFEKDEWEEQQTDPELLAQLSQGSHPEESEGPVYDVKEPYRNWICVCLNDFAEKLTTMRLVQTRARLETVELPIVEIDSKRAFETAREHRLDWMNQRSKLVDTWRNIEIAANDLRGAVDLSVGGSISNEGSNMLNFSEDNAEMNASVKFDAPLDRLRERNAYRRALISYDQARRTYYRYVDSVNLQIRDMIRSIELNQMELELKRESVRVAIIQVHLAQLALNKPTGATTNNSLGSTSARDLVEALNSLLESQNNFMKTWLQYQVQRMSILLQLGLFRIDGEGKWVDPGDIDDAFLTREGMGLLPQDSLFGMDQLQPVETLTGGVSADQLRARIEAE